MSDLIFAILVFTKFYYVHMFINLMITYDEYVDDCKPFKSTRHFYLSLIPFIYWYHKIKQEFIKDILIRNYKELQGLNNIKYPESKKEEKQLL